MFGLLRQRNFSLLWFGQLLSLMGDWVLLVALPFYVYDLTGSALLTGVMWMVESLPRLLLGSLAGEQRGAGQVIDVKREGNCCP